MPTKLGSFQHVLVQRIGHQPRFMFNEAHKHDIFLQNTVFGEQSAYRTVHTTACQFIHRRKKSMGPKITLNLSRDHLMISLKLI